MQIVALAETAKAVAEEETTDKPCSNLEQVSSPSDEGFCAESVQKRSIDMAPIATSNDVPGLRMAKLTATCRRRLILAVRVFVATCHRNPKGVDLLVRHRRIFPRKRAGKGNYAPSWRETPKAVDLLSPDRIEMLNSGLGFLNRPFAVPSNMSPPSKQIRKPSL